MEELFDTVLLLLLLQNGLGELVITVPELEVMRSKILRLRLENGGWIPSTDSGTAVTVRIVQLEGVIGLSSRQMQMS